MLCLLGIHRWGGSLKRMEGHYTWFNIRRCHRCKQEQREYITYDWMGWPEVEWKNWPKKDAHRARENEAAKGKE